MTQLFKDFKPEIDSLETENGKWFRGRVYSDASTFTAIKLPDGWSVETISGPKAKITHNTGTTNYSVVVSISANVDLSIRTLNRQANSFEVSPIGASALYAQSFDFIFILD